MTRGLYPQRQEKWPDALEIEARLLASRIRHLWMRHKYNLKYVVNRVDFHAQAIEKLSEQAMAEHINDLRRQLLRQGLEERLVLQAFATVREMAHRTLGQRHFDVQLLGGWVMMNGMIAEMETGEGKTLTASLPACTAALAGVPVHILTANDYLADRDEQLLKPLYQQLGIRSAAVIGGMESESRKMAYQCGIVHSTGQQVAFDYLRDRMEMGNDIGDLQIQLRQLQNRQQQRSSAFLLRGLCFAIVDEADSLLIDEARMPLIISRTGQTEAQKQIYFDALYLATSLENGTDFNIDEQRQEVGLTVAGKQKLSVLAAPLDEYWLQRRHRETMVLTALKAERLLRCNEHYLLRDGKVEIIDAVTGRAMPERSFEHGLHQLIEAKEGCEITAETNPLARISYQRFFKRYLHLSGMTGTAVEARRELHGVYGLRVLKIPVHKLSRRKIYPEKVYGDAEQKSAAFVKKVTALHRQGRPVLIGTRTVAESEAVSRVLLENGLSHQVLNALQDRQEAEVIAKAGQLNKITVATNMAGRGTDITLGTGIEALGGLHVIATERNESRRIDRQLYGRCGRQGDAGSGEAFMSLQDETLVVFYPAAVLGLVAKLCRDNKPLPGFLGKVLLALPQKWVEYRHYQLRRLLMKQDRQRARTLSFTGREE